MSNSIIDWLPIKKIENGMIELKDKTKIKGFMLDAKNIHILNNQNQTREVMSIKNAYNQINFPFYEYVIHKEVDLRGYTARLMSKMNELDNDDYHLRKMYETDLEKVNYFSQHVKDVLFFITVQDKDLAKLNQKLESLQMGYSSTGVHLTPLKNEDLRLLINHIFNNGKNYTFDTTIIGV